LFNSFNLKEKITAAFDKSADIDPAKITVRVNGRMVTLTGIVSSMAQKVEAENTAWLVPGVTSVESEFVIKKREYSLNA
jgi:osmotically-inducible protein OsmY